MAILAAACCGLALLLTLFGGVTVFAHAHDRHGMHLHAAWSRDAAATLAARHVAEHRAGEQTEERRVCRHHPHHPHHHHPATPEQQDPSPISAIIITLPDADQHTPRGWCLPPLRVVACILIARASIDACLQFPAATTPNAGCARDGPLHLCALAAPQRILRTSLALLL